MLIRFYGVRGSSPVCDLDAWRYGGNTPCVLVETSGGHRLLLDAGTGVRPLARTWTAMGEPIRAGWFLSHYHWDHIQGLPVFRPLYDARNHFEFWGPPGPGGEGVQAALQGQMRRPYFPVDLSALAAAHAFTQVAPGDRWRTGDVVVEAARLHHPEPCLGFRFEAATGTLAYATDTEPGDAAADAAVRHLARGADVLIYDAHFAPDGLATRRGWGHSSWREGIQVMRDAGARCLVLFHHDPEADDAELDRRVQRARQEWPETWGAAEGMEITCQTPGVMVERRLPRFGPRIPTEQPIRLRGLNAEGDALELGGIIANATVKSVYLIVPGFTSLEPEVELDFLNGTRSARQKRGRIIRTILDPRTIQPGVVVVLDKESQLLSPASGRHGETATLSARGLLSAATLADPAVDAVIHLDADCAILCWNTRAEQVLRLTSEYALGGDFVRLLVPSDQATDFLARLASPMRDALASAGAGWETELLDQDGRRVPVRIWAWRPRTSGCRPTLILIIRRR
jgi:phosphoribosyl 1,2-cyclic phosphodiesterase